jgi:hypothetical protein
MRTYFSESFYGMLEEQKNKDSAFLKQVPLINLFGNESTTLLLGNCVTAGTRDSPYSWRVSSTVVCGVFRQVF